MSMKRLYAEIAKTEQQEDGTIKVWGYASSGCVDSDGETITSDAMKAALPDYMKFGAIREMHSSTNAAGTAIEAEVQDDGRTWFGAHVVDPIAVKKVGAGVYKGFSIGGKVVKRDDLNKKIINSINLIEVSLVDRPANPEAVFTMYKVRADDVLGGVVDTDAQSLEDDKTAADELTKAVETLKFHGFTDEGGEQWKPPIGSIEKAGARYSKSTKTALKAAHDACKAADAALAKLGYEDAEEADDDQTKAAQTDDLQKACTIAGCPDGTSAAEWLAEISAELESMRTIAKAADIEGATPSALVNALAKRVKEQGEEIAKLKDQPAPPKGYANGVALSKADDRAGGDAKEVAPVTTSDGEENEVATLVKAAQAKPFRVF